MKDFIGIILAAGEGIRMKSDTPKVLHNICGRPMIDYVIDALEGLRLKKIYVVLNKKQEQLTDYLKQNKDIKFVFQKKPLGTADAVNSAKSILGKSKANVLVICADTPLIRNETLQELINKHKEKNASCTILTSQVDNSLGFGRILRDQYSKVSHIIEENDASFSQKQIKEVNSGVYCFKTPELLEALNQIQINTKKGEYYFTDIIQILYEKNKIIDTEDCFDEDEILGINSRQDLSIANDIMRLRIIKELTENGVTIISPETTFVNHGSSMGKDTVIYPFTFIDSGVKVGEDCSIGPFCHLRKGTVIKDKNRVGSFTEIVRSTLGKGTLFKHFGYLGDTVVGDNVNIGAGTVIANFDGRNKNPTVIKDNAFIGCDTIVVAPAKIGKRAVTGAGAVITKNSNVKDNSVVVGIPAKPLIKSSKIFIKKHKEKKRRK